MSGLEWLGGIILFWSYTSYRWCHSDVLINGNGGEEQGPSFFGGSERMRKWPLMGRFPVLGTCYRLENSSKPAGIRSEQTPYCQQKNAHSLKKICSSRETIENVMNLEDPQKRGEMKLVPRTSPRPFLEGKITPLENPRGQNPVWKKWLAIYLWENPCQGHPFAWKQAQTFGAQKKRISYHLSSYKIPPMRNPLLKNDMESSPVRNQFF